MKENLNDKLIAAVRVRGRVNVRHDVTETLNRLRLKRVSNCALIKVTPQYRGMLNKATNHIAFGEVDEETLSKLVAKFKLNIDPKALISGKADAKALKEKMPLRLHPPRHGYKNIRLHYNQGGTLGYMGKDINGLIKRMI